MSTQAVIRWTRQADGSYAKEGALPAEISDVRIFAIDEDYETNPHAVCPGLKLWPKEEAVELVERKISDGSIEPGGMKFDRKCPLPRPLLPESRLLRIGVHTAYVRMNDAKKVPTKHVVHLKVDGQSIAAPLVASMCVVGTARILSRARNLPANAGS